MLVIGITNKLPRGLRLFMWEIDGIEEYNAYEEANFLSQAFDIDVYLLESSKDHYHLISFDILDLETVSRIQNWVIADTDYLNIKELPLFDDKGFWNTLRIGNKGVTPNPRYLTVFYANLKEPKPKSLQHFKLYQYFCGIPPEPEPQCFHFFNVGYVMLAVYNTGIGAKRRLKPLFKGVIN